MRIDSLQALYDGYLKDAIQVEKNRKPGEGIFGKRNRKVRKSGKFCP